MEKVSLYIKKILALLLSFSLVYIIGFIGYSPTVLNGIIVGALASFLFAYLVFRITGEKPRFLFGLNQSDTYLNKKGGFWNLFKWLVILFGLLYDLVVWSLWGVYLVFVLFVDLLLLIKFIVYWIIHAIIWFLRQLFPPFIFLFKMIMHYIFNWIWWIYQLAVNNVKNSINKNFYFIALWGTVPALFIVFLFYAISQLVGIPELIFISAVFAIIPLVWSFGEISALRFEKREKDPYSLVRLSFRNGFDAVRSVLFYLIIAFILIAVELVLNLIGWIPNLSMSLLGITLNINMAISLLLVFLAIIIAFACRILPTHILYKPEHDNDLDSALGLLLVIGRKFLRYTFVGLPASIFGSFLLLLPIIVMLLTFTLTDSIKDGILDARVNNLTEKSQSMEKLEAYRTDIKIKRLIIYKEIPEKSPDYFAKLRNTSNQISAINNNLQISNDQLDLKRAQYDKEMSVLAVQLSAARAANNSNQPSEQVINLTNQLKELKEANLQMEKSATESVAFLKADIREQKSFRFQMPILYFFVGILFAIFGGIVFAVYVSYLGNVYFELYNLREDGKATYWCEILDEIREKDPNQPLLGFTFLVIVIVPIVLLLTGLIQI